MKLAIAPLLLSSVFASPDSKAAKLAKAKFPKAKASKSGYGSMCMSTLSMSMSVGPEPPTPTPEPSPQPTLTQVSPSQAPSDVCTPLPSEDGIYIKEDGEIVFWDTTEPQCKKIGDWDPTAQGIKIENDIVTTSSEAALEVGFGNSKQVVVIDQTFDATALSSGSGSRNGAKLDTSSSSATFCGSTFVGERVDDSGGGKGVESEGSLNIVDSTLIGDFDGLLVTGGKTVIVGTKTSIVNVGNAGVSIFHTGGTLEIHQGTFGDLTEPHSLVALNGGVSVYGGTWNAPLLYNSNPNWGLNAYVNDVSNPTKLCDGSDITGKLVSGQFGINFLPCPADYKVPTFPECE